LLIEGNSPYLANAIAHVSCPNTLPIGPAIAVWRRFENRIDSSYVQDRMTDAEEPFLHKTGG
jgi:hypothetical protein